MQKLFQPPYGLHRILSSYWLAHFYFMTKNAKMLLYFGLDCWMLPQSNPAFLEHGWAEKITVWAHANRDPIKQDFELLSNIQDQKKEIAVDVFFKAYLMVPLSCRDHLAGRYLYEYLHNWLSRVTVPCQWLVWGRGRNWPPTRGCVWGQGGLQSCSHAPATACAAPSLYSSLEK